METRITPLPESELTDEVKEILRGLERDGQVFNIFRTLARHPKLLKKWLVFANYILSQSTLPAREREIVILRVGWLSRAEYEWGHHVDIGKRKGLSDSDITRIAEGADAEGWNDLEAALIRAVDELHANSVVSDSTWERLAAQYNTEQLLDVLFTAGQYRLVSMVLNSTGIQLEEGFEGFPDEAQR